MDEYSGIQIGEHLEEETTTEDEANDRSVLCNKWSCQMNSRKGVHVPIVDFVTDILFLITHQPLVTLQEDHLQQ